MASAKDERWRPLMRPWRERALRLWRRTLCRWCLCSETDSLQEQEEKINGGPWHPHMDQRGSGENETIQITVEDLGIANASFRLLDEDPPTLRKRVARSVTSASACSGVLKRNRLRNLSSLPSQPHMEAAAAVSSDKPQEEDLSLFGSESTSGSGSFLAPPAINLIPPTPSDVADDQFFDNSEESVPHTSDGNSSAASEEGFEESAENEALEERRLLAEGEDDADREGEPVKGLSHEEQRETGPIKKDEDEELPELLRSVSQVAPLPKNLHQRSVDTGINLLSFTEHILDDLSGRELSSSDMAKAELSLLPSSAAMDTLTKRRPLTRSCSLGETMTRSATFHALTQAADQRQEEGLPQRRRVTVASYMPRSTDQNGNFPEKDEDRREAKSLKELNTEEVCQWFAGVGLQKCLPFIREAKLSGAEIASVDVKTLDILQIVSLEEREQLLSAIYNELHPPSSASQKLDSLLGSAAPSNVETFTTTRVSMSKSKSSPHVSCLSMNRRSLKLRNNSQRNCQLVEITINASERIVHLRTPRETTVGKIMESCIKMLGVTEDKSLFTMKEKQGSPEELPLDQQIGVLLSSVSSSSSSLSESTQLELHLCKIEKPANSPDVNINSNMNKNIQGNQPAKEERMRELNQQVDSLQHAVLQIQELHHGLVAFCSELKNSDGDENLDQLGSAQLKQRLELVNHRLNDKRQSLQTLRDDINNFAAHKKKQLEVRLLEKMKLNCQVFKEEITIVHLSRQAAHLQNALQDSCVKEKAETKTGGIGSLSQLVSPLSPAMLLVVQENQNPDGRYGFTCGQSEGGGLVVVKVDDSRLCVDDRVVEANGELVVNSTPEQLADILLRGPSAQVVVLRQPPPIHTSAVVPRHAVSPDPIEINRPGRNPDATEATPQRKVMAI